MRTLCITIAFLTNLYSQTTQANIINMDNEPNYDTNIDSANKPESKANSNLKTNSVDSKDDSNNDTIDDSSDNNENNSIKKGLNSSNTQDSTLIDYEFVEYENASLLQNIVDRFQINNETYLLPIYYSISKPYIPPGSNTPYKRAETKLQVSFKTLIARDIIANIGMYFAYTQTSFFQIYSPKMSSPFRDNDFMPEVVFYRPLDIGLLGGKLYNVRLGYNHISNGEGTDPIGHTKSRGEDNIFAELMWSYADLEVALRIWKFIRFDPRDLDKYMGFSSLKIAYHLFNIHHFIINVQNLVHNYKKYKGNVRAEYRYDIFDRVALYGQYFYGYGDNIYQYNIRTQNIGLGIAVAH